MPAYWLTPAVGREHPTHGMTVNSLIQKRWRENTSAAAVGLFFFTPFMTHTDAQVRKLAEQQADRDVQVEELKPILIESGKYASISFATVLARVAVQTSIASILIERNTALSNSMVYHWDMYPRLHRKYIGDLLEAIYLPRSIAAVMGPETRQEDLNTVSASCSPSAAAQDSFKRHVITYTASSIVKMITIGIECGMLGKKAKPSRRDRVNAGLVQIGWDVLAVVGFAAGAGVGHALKGGAGEYWGEYIGGYTAIIGVRLALAFLNKPQPQPNLEDAPLPARH